MEKRVLKTLEFNKIIQQVATHCTSVAGRAHVEQLTPSRELEDVQRLLEETDEGLALLRIRGNVPMGVFMTSDHMRNVRKSAEC